MSRENCPVPRHWPYQTDILYEATPEKDAVWWPTCSLPGDEMIIGDKIPGDEETAVLCARVANIVYEQALDDVRALFEKQGLDVEKFLLPLTRRFVCQHPREDGEPGPCDANRELEKTEWGYRCSECGGMHHFDGRLKTAESIPTCHQGCCDKSQPMNTDE